MVPNQNPIIPRIGDKQLAILDPKADRTAKAACGRRCNDGFRSEIRLPQNNIGRLSEGCWNAIPNQYAIVVRIRDSEDVTVGSDTQRVIHAAAGCGGLIAEAGIVAGVIGLTQNIRCSISANPTLVARVLRLSGIGVRARERRRAECNDAIIT